MKLNLGCGKHHKAGYVNIDIAPEVNPDMLIDLSKGILPYEDNSINEIYSSHFLEHIPVYAQIGLLRECYRVSKPGALWVWVLPFDNMNGRTVIGHYSTYYFWSFDQYLESCNSGYQTQEVKLRSLNEWGRSYRWFFTFFPFLKDSITFRFEVVK